MRQAFMLSCLIVTAAVSAAPTATQDPQDTSLPRLLKAPADVCRVFLTTVADVPAQYYTIVKKEVQVGKKFYGTHDGLLRELARQASKVNADAVIGVHSWRAPSAWSWAAAKTGGMAVRWTDAGRAAFSNLKGECWDPSPQKAKE